MKVASFEIVFQEVPDEVTLALNISGCPNRCPGCHSPHLWEDTGEELSPALLNDLVARYAPGITCVCFMGGDQDPDYVATLAEQVRQCGLKAAWYSGRTADPNEPEGLKNLLAAFDYVKFGPYVEALGGLKSPTTNQRLYKCTPDGWQDITFRLQKK